MNRKRQGNGSQRSRALKRRMPPGYYKVRNPHKALIRDLVGLLQLDTIRVMGGDADGDGVELRINLDWPTQTTETEFFRRVRTLPKG